MRRGEIWWSQQPPPIGRRPVVLLSRDESYRVRNSILIAQITTKMRGIPTEVILDEKDGMPKKCIINLDNITTIRKSILTERICTLSAVKMVEVEEAIKFAIALK